MPKVLSMELDWITTKQAAEKWDLGDWRIQTMLTNDVITGVTSVGRVWLIPKDAPKSTDGSVKN